MSRSPSEASPEIEKDSAAAPDQARAARNLKLTIEYDGSAFHGWQVQPGFRTVEGVLEEGLRDLEGASVDLHGASRTDQGVHALGQCGSFLSSSRIPVERYARALNGRLPPDVRVTKVEEVASDFHARFSAVGKHYRYLIDRGETANVFFARYALHLPEPIDLDAMRSGAELFTGERDFASYRCESGALEESTVRRVQAVLIEADRDWIAIDVWGTSFLYKMVRTMAGSLLEVGRLRWPPRRIAESLEARDRRAAGPTAPGHALCLKRVFYDPVVFDEAVVALRRAVASGDGQLPRFH